MILLLYMNENINAINSINISYLSGYKFMLLSDISILGSKNLDCSEQWFYNLKNNFKLDTDSVKDKIEIIKNSKIFFIKRDFVEYFINNFYKYLQNNIILISHCSDIPVKDTFILDLPKIKKWYALNTLIKHDKLVSIPIGLTTHEKKHGNMQLLKNISEMNIQKNKLLYANFNVNTNRSIRLSIKNIIESKNYKVIDGDKPLEQEDYWKELSSSKFCISPPGNGVDCHRIWECIYLNTIPIVKKHYALEEFYDMKILFIDDWNIINNEFLEKKYNEFQNKNFNNEKCYYDYWKNLIINS